MAEGDFVDSCLLKSLFVGDICQSNLPHKTILSFLCILGAANIFVHTHKIFCFAPNLVQTCWAEALSLRCCSGIVTTAFRDWIRHTGREGSPLPRRFPRVHTHSEGDAHSLI